jgi:hypothetical protein
MAHVSIGVLEAQEGHFPPTCIRCGRPATVYKSARLTWRPELVHLLLIGTFLPFVIFALLSRKRMRIKAPFCEVHRNYWLNRRILRLIAFMAPPLVVGAVLLLSGTSELPERLQTPWGLLWIISVAWLVLFAAVRFTGIRPTRIDDESMDLSGASPEFVERLTTERVAGDG